MYPHARSDPGRNSGPRRYPGSFLVALREALAQIGWQPQRWLGQAVACLDAADHEQVLGLENLYRRLRREDRASWPALILEMLRSVPPEVAEPVPLADVAGRILVRLGPAFAPAPQGKEVWFQPLVGKRLGATLVIDHANSMSYVTTEQITDSGESGEAWLDRAVANLRRQTPADCLGIVHPESGLRQSEVGDAYDSSRALLLDWLLPGHEENGFFLALPGRDHLLVLPVVKEALEHVAWLRGVTAQTHQTVPYPISSEIFWVRNRQWHHFGVSIVHKQVLVTPPPEFAAVLQRLAPDLSIELPEDTDDSGSLPN